MISSPAGWLKSVCRSLTCLNMPPSYSVDDLQNSSLANAKSLSNTSRRFAISSHATYPQNLVLGELDVPSPAFACHVSHVVLVCPKEKVGNVDAPWVVALVQHKKIDGNWPTRKLPCNAGRSQRFRASATFKNYSIARVVYAAVPDDAAAISCAAFGEPFSKPFFKRPWHGSVCKLALLATKPRPAKFCSARRPAERRTTDKTRTLDTLRICSWHGLIVTRNVQE